MRLGRHLSKTIAHEKRSNYQLEGGHDEQADIAQQSKVKEESDKFHDHDGQNLHEKLGIYDVFASFKYQFW